MSSDRAVAVVLGHTRWASVGIISQPNAHPVDSAELASTRPLRGGRAQRRRRQLRGPQGAGRAEDRPRDHHRREGDPHARGPAGGRGDRPRDRAFRNTVASFEGSVAIAAAASAEPGKLLLALRGSGQALYVGVTDGAYIVASEPYGVIELTSDYLRMDGETPANADNPTASAG